MKPKPFLRCPPTWITEPGSLKHQHDHIEGLFTICSSTMSHSTQYQFQNVYGVHPKLSAYSYM